MFGICFIATLVFLAWTERQVINYLEKQRKDKMKAAKECKKSWN